MTSVDAPGAALAARLAASTADLQRLGAGAAICTFSRAGVAVPGLKYTEGRWAALRQVQRSPLFERDSAGAVAEVVADWADDLTRQQARQAGPDWIAYRTGGLDALAELAKDLNLTSLPFGTPAIPYGRLAASAVPSPTRPGSAGL